MYKKNDIISKSHYNEMYKEIKKEVLDEIVKEGILNILKIDNDRLGKYFDREIEKTFMETND